MRTEYQDTSKHKSAERCDQAAKNVHTMGPKRDVLCSRMHILRTVVTVVLVVLPVAPLGHEDEKDQGRDERRLVVVKLWSGRCSYRKEDNARKDESRRENK